MLGGYFSRILEIWPSGEGAGRSLFQVPGKYVFAGGWRALFRPALPRTAPPLQTTQLSKLLRSQTGPPKRRSLWDVRLGPLKATLGAGRSLLQDLGNLVFGGGCLEVTFPGSWKLGLWGRWLGGHFSRILVIGFLYEVRGGHFPRSLTFCFWERVAGHFSRVLDVRCCV